MRDEFSPEMLDAMRKGRAHPGNLKRVPLPKGSPQTATIALPGLRAYEDAALSGSETGGYVLGLAPVGDDTMFLRKDRDPVTVAHEAEHLLAKRQLEHPSEINTAFDSLVEDKRSPSIRHQFVIDAVSAYPYLQDKYGLQSAYFEPGMYNYQRRAGVASNLLYEQLASLAAIEQMQGVDLTKDPVLRETLFRDKDVRETYNALVGLRQTRLDSKDIRPHTRIAEPSMLDKVKKAIGFAEGGEVKDFFGDRDPNEPITPEQIEEFNRYINEHLQKQRKKEEEWDYPYRENDAILAKGYSKGGEATKGSEYDPLFQAAGEKYGVDPSILRAIASVESNFNPEAIGPKTRSGRAQGMMQFIPATAKAYGLEDPFNPEQSVDAAARLMRDLQKQFKGDVGKALEAYNGGPRLVGKSKQTAKYREMVLARAGRTPSDDIPTPAEPFMAAKSAPTQLKQGQMYGEAPKTRPEAPRTVSMGTIEAMPLNYRTAFALQYLADNEPDDDPEVKANDLLARLDELEISEGTEGKSALTSFFAETTAPTPTAFQIMQSKKQKQQKRAVPSMKVVQGFREGGEVDISEQMTVGTLPKDAKDYREVLEGLKKSAADIRRGIQYFPADLVGSGVDVINMGLKPFGLGSDKPFMGSQYLIDKGVEAGIYEKPSGSGVETLTRMAGLPALATRSVGRGIASLEESLKGPPEGAVKPRGGIIDPGKLFSEDAISMNTLATQRGEPPLLTATRITAEMKELDGLNRPITPEHREKLLRFIDSKYSKYLKNDFGTEGDIVRQKVLSGEVVPPVDASGMSLRLFSNVEEYLKDPTNLTKKGSADFFYDASTNIAPMMLVRAKDFSPEVLRILKTDPEKSGTFGAVKRAADGQSEGATFFLTDFPSDRNFRDMIKNYGRSLASNVEKIKQEGAFDPSRTIANQVNFKILDENEYAALDDTLKRAVNKELVFDMSEPPSLTEVNPERLIETLSVVPPEKLDNMNFAQAYSEGTAIMNKGGGRDYDRGLGLVLSGKSVPKEFLFAKTTPVLETKNGKWVHFDDSRVNLVEGKLMGHSIHGYGKDKPYGLGQQTTGKQAFDSGDVEIFSLRDEKGFPMVSLEYGKFHQSNHPKYVHQIQGKFNSAPTEYIVDVLRLMKEKGFEFPPNRGLLSDNNEYRVNRKGEPLKYFDKTRGKEVIEYDIIDWPALKKAYDANPDNLQIVKIAKPEDTQNLYHNETVYTTRQRLNAANSPGRPGGFIERRARGGFVTKPLYDRA